MERTGESDGELLERLCAGDARALSVLYDRHSVAVSRYAWGLAADRHDVEEVVQDTFVTLWRSARRIRLVQTSVLPWLLVTCRNHARNVTRKHHAASVVAFEGDLPWWDGSAAQEQLRWVMEAISELDAVDQRVCELCLVEGRPYKEAAAVLGISVGAIKQRVSRSRARLRKAMAENEG